MADPVGPILDGLGCTAIIGSGELVAGAVVVLKAIDPDGHMRLVTCWSDGMSEGSAWGPK